MKPKLTVPKTIHRALEMGGTLAVSISGGKDSQAMLNVLAHWWAIESPTLQSGCREWVEYCRMQTNWRGDDRFKYCKD